MPETTKRGGDEMTALVPVKKPRNELAVAGNDKNKSLIESVS